MVGPTQRPARSCWRKGYEGRSNVNSEVGGQVKYRRGMGKGAGKGKGTGTGKGKGTGKGAGT